MFNIETDQSNPFGQIIRMLLLRQNGVTSASIKQTGISYKTNLGVSVSDLRKIASRFEKENKLADKLWDHRWRETMLISTMLCDASNIDPQLIDKWIKSIRTIELSESLAMYVLVDYQHFESNLEEWLRHKNEYCAIACYNALCKRIAKKMEISEKGIEVTICTLDAFEKSNGYILAASRALSFILRVNLQYKNEILSKIEELTKRDNRWILAKDIIDTELKYR